MRLRRVTVVGLAVALVVGGGMTMVASTAQAAITAVPSVGVRLPVQDFRVIELDEDRGRLYVGQGAGGGLPLVVTDLDGRLVTRVDSVTDVSDVVLSDDGNTLYVTQGFDRVSALDPQSLTVRATYPAPDGACVYDAVPTGGKVVGSFSDCGINSGGLLVWSAPDTAPVVYTFGPNYEPRTDASPGAPGLVVTGDTGVSPATTYVIDVSGASPRIVAQRRDAGSNLQDVAISPDGTEVVESMGYPYEHRSYRMPDLADDTVYPSGPYPLDAAWSGDGSTVAVGRYDGYGDVFLYGKDSTTPIYAVDFPGGDVLWGGTVLVNRAGTRAWAVSYDDVYQNVALLHSFGPGHAPIPPETHLGVTATAGSGKAKQTANITVTWTSPISGILNAQQFYWSITASTNGGPETEFWRGNMDASGQYSLTYALPKGTTTFTVRFHDVTGFYPDGYATATVTR